MIEENEARRRILESLAPREGEEEVPLSLLCGRVLSRDLHARVDLPPADNSSVDGYALRAADISGASTDAPVRLPLAGSLPAGAAPGDPLPPGHCLRLYTGSFLPPGADAVLMQEDAAWSDGDLLVRRPLRLREHVRLRGEDLRARALLLEAGERVSVRHLGVLAAAGHALVPVRPRPRVALIPTGRELQPPGDPLRPGAVYESNRVVLEVLCGRIGALPRPCPPVPDDTGAIAEALAEAAGDSDVLVTCGGVSVGDHDLVPDAIRAAGGSIAFHGVRMQPGKPFLLGWLGHRPVFGLPGNPVSAITTFMLLVRPALLHLQGARRLELPQRRGTLSVPLANGGVRPHYLRVRIDAQGTVEPVGLQGSHALRGLSLADGWVRVQPRETLPAAREVTVLFMEEIAPSLDPVLESGQAEHP